MLASARALMTWLALATAHNGCGGTNRMSQMPKQHNGSNFKQH